MELVYTRLNSCINGEIEMDNRTGMVLPEDVIPDGQEKHFQPVNRDLTAREKMESQIKLYSPCACGSGKKFKFCCKRPAP